MTPKEFKEALNTADFDVDNYGYESIINLLIGKLHADADDLERRDLKAGAAYVRERADLLYDILDMRGYYND